LKDDKFWKDFGYGLGNYSIAIKGTISQSPVDMSAYPNINTNNLTNSGSGGKLLIRGVGTKGGYLKLKAKGSLLKLNAKAALSVVLTADPGGSLSLEGLSDNTAGLISVEVNNTLSMEEGVTITGNAWGGVFIGAGGSFKMNGGSIKENLGKGGVSLLAGEKTNGQVNFIMSGGTIKDNKDGALYLSGSDYSKTDLYDAYWTGDTPWIIDLNGDGIKDSEKSLVSLYLAADTTKNVAIPDDASGIGSKDSIEGTEDKPFVRDGKTWQPGMGDMDIINNLFKGAFALDSAHSSDTIRTQTEATAIYAGADAVAFKAAHTGWEADPGSLEAEPDEPGNLEEEPDDPPPPEEEPDDPPPPEVEPDDPPPPEVVDLWSLVGDNKVILCKDGEPLDMNYWYDSLDACLAELNTLLQGDNWTNSGYGSGNLSIAVKGTINQDPVSLSAYQNITTDKLTNLGGTLLIKGVGTTVSTLKLNSQGNLLKLDAASALSVVLTADSGSSLILEGISDNNASLVYVKTNNILTMEDGVTITRNVNDGPINDDDDGGGVNLDGGTFYMEGGTISGNKTTDRGGGVYIVMNSTFKMNGGSIQGNRGKGGISFVTQNNRQVNFIMSGGTIKDNIDGAIYLISNYDYSRKELYDAYWTKDTPWIIDLNGDGNRDNEKSLEQFSLASGSIQYLAIPHDASGIGAHDSIEGAEDNPFVRDGVTWKPNLGDAEIIHHLFRGAFIGSDWHDDLQPIRTQRDDTAIYAGADAVAFKADHSGWNDDSPPPEVVDLWSLVGDNKVILCKDGEPLDMNYWYDSLNACLTKLDTLLADDNWTNYGYGSGNLSIAVKGTIDQGPVSMSSYPNITTDNITNLGGKLLIKGVGTTGGKLKAQRWLLYLNAASALSVVLTADTGSSLTLEGLSNNTYSLVYVYPNNTLIMEDGVTITGNASNSAGGGVYLSGSTFYMKGGTISNNSTTGSGGGVYLNSSTFYMKGGTISSNSATYGGGGVYIGKASTFKMNGGSIQGNLGKGGICFTTRDNSHVNFIMSGGTIKNNKNGAIYLLNYDYSRVDLYDAYWTKDTPWIIDLDGDEIKDSTTSPVPLYLASDTTQDVDVDIPHDASGRGASDSIEGAEDNPFVRDGVTWKPNLGDAEIIHHLFRGAFIDSDWHNGLQPIRTQRDATAIYAGADALAFNEDKDWGAEF
jgi:hypothetical protein